MLATTIYLRRTQANGKAVVTEHWVWDRELFLASQVAAEQQLQVQGKDHCTIEAVTRAEYTKSNWRRR